MGTIAAMRPDAALALSPTLEPDAALRPFRACLIALPFLAPWTAGPSASAWQLLLTWACAAALLATSSWATPHRGLLLWLGIVAAGICVGRGDNTSSWLSAFAAITVIAIVAGTIAGQEGRSGGAATLAWALLAAGVLNAVVGVLQHCGEAAMLGSLAVSTETGRAYGNLRQPNQFATLLNMALVSALWLQGHRARQHRWVLASAVLILMLGQVASASRTGMLQLLAIVCVGVGLEWRRRPSTTRSADGRWQQLGWLLSLLPLYAFFGWLLSHSAGSVAPGALQRLDPAVALDDSRFLLWHNMLDLIAERPWTGWGWGELRFAHYSALYEGARFPTILDNAHNLPLHLAVELGIPAALLICSGFVWLVLATRPWRERDPTRLMAWGLLGVISLHSLLEYPLWYGPFQLVFGLCLGLLWPGPERRGSSTRVATLSAAAATLLMAMVGYAAWDYLRVSQIYVAREERLPSYREQTLEKLQHSWLFADHVRFAELSITPITRDNASQMHALAQAAMHFSPEPRVVVKLIESAALLGLDDEVRAQRERFQRAYPEAYIQWLAGHPPR